MRAGARGYLLKGADQDEIVRAVSGIFGGEAIFGPTVARRIIDFFAERPPRPTQPVFPELTAREHEVLDMIAAGRSNTQVAKMPCGMGPSPASVVARLLYDTGFGEGLRSQFAGARGGPQ